LGRDLNIAIVLGSLREEGFSRKIAREIVALSQAANRRHCATGPSFAASRLDDRESPQLG
jgi:NAD(P)H-dependent FMN reductase